MKEKKWREIFPGGRHIFYEGDDPEAFAQEIIEKYGFDPRERAVGWDNDCGYCFHCPPEHLDEIYTKYPTGS